MIDNDQILENMRFYGNMRFKQFSLYLAWLTLSGTAIIHASEKIVLLNTKLKLIVAFASLLVCAVIWIMEISSTIFWVAHKSSLEDDYPKLDKIWGQVNATNATLIFYVLNYIFWWLCAFHWDGRLVFILCYAVLFILLILFTIKNYTRLWVYNENNPK